jgi:hypothetical protein
MVPVEESQSGQLPDPFETRLPQLLHTSRVSHSGQRFQLWLTGRLHCGQVNDPRGDSQVGQTFQFGLTGSPHAGHRLFGSGLFMVLI